MRTREKPSNPVTETSLAQRRRAERRARRLDRAPHLGGACERRGPLGRGRPPIPRLRRRNRYAQHRTRQPEGRGGDRRSGGALHASLLSSGDVRTVRAGRRRAQSPRARVRRRKNHCCSRPAPRRPRTRSRSRASTRGAPQSSRLQHAYHGRTLLALSMTGKERAVQTALRAVLQRDLPRAVSLRTSRRHDEPRARRRSRKLFSRSCARSRRGDHRRAGARRGRLRSGAAATSCPSCGASPTRTESS